MKQSFALGEFFTVFQTEVLILKGTEQLQEKSNSQRSICIYPESQAVLNAVSCPRAISAVDRKCGDALKLTGNIEVLLLWVSCRFWVPGQAVVLSRESVCANVIYLDSQ